MASHRQSGSPTCSRPHRPPARDKNRTRYHRSQDISRPAGYVGGTRIWLCSSAGPLRQALCRSDWQENRIFVRSSSYHWGGAARRVVLSVGKEQIQLVNFSSIGRVARLPLFNYLRGRPPHEQNVASRSRRWSRTTGETARSIEAICTAQDYGSYLRVHFLEQPR